VEDAEVEGVERGVQAGPQLGVRTGSWMTEVGVDVEEAIASQVSVDLELGDLSQSSVSMTGRWRPKTTTDDLQCMLYYSKEHRPRKRW
jgi:hypothetical protein